MQESIGIVTGGGDCPGLNAVIRAVAKASAKRGWKTLGFLGGFEGLFAPARFVELDYQAMGNLLTRGGTILGTANRGSFSVKRGMGESQQLPQELLDGVRATMSEMGIRALVSVGGDGSLTIAQQLFEAGVPVVGVPKTIDNDLECTDFTFGFDSAVACATDALDRLHSTAESHDRILVLEVMGRHAGWITLFAAIAGGGDVVLLPEIPFCYESICAKIAEREAQGKHFTLVVVAEGARERGCGIVTAADQPADREAILGGVAAVVATNLESLTGKEARVCVLGHLQRGGTPTAFDRTLCSCFGAEAVQLVADGTYGHMVAFSGGVITSVPIADAVGRLKTVPPQGRLVQTARALGMCFGD